MIIDVSLFVRVSKKLQQEIDERTERMATGSGVYTPDPASTGLAYARTLGFLEGLRGALALLEESRRELEGGDDDEDDRKKRKKEYA